MTEYYPEDQGVGAGTHAILMVIVRIYPTSVTCTFQETHRDK